MKILHAYGITGEYKLALKSRGFDADAFEAGAISETTCEE